MVEKYVPTPAESFALSFAQQAHAAWHEGEVFVTPRVAFCMRAVTERCRKNYYGVYDQPLDESTGSEKYWPPLTEHMVETVVKETDIDTRNMKPYVSNPALAGVSRVAKLLLHDKLRRMNMDAKLNDIIRSASIDGSRFLRCVKVWDRRRKRWVRDMALPDTLNVVADPAADSIEQSAYLERLLMSPAEFRSMATAKPVGWGNLDHAKPSKDVQKTDYLSGAAVQGGPSPYYEVWEMWAWLPAWVVRGEKEDDMSGDELMAHVVMSGVGRKSGRGAGAVVHLIEKEDYGTKPVKEVRFRKVPNRRQGRGVAEAIFGAQLYLNHIVGDRQANGAILRNGLFKVRKGSGLTQEVVTDLAQGGFIPVEMMDDIEQLAVQDYRASSYSDENNVFNWASRQTFANEQVRGERTVTSQAATSSIIQDRSSKNAFGLIQEDLARPIAEFFEEFIIPKLAEEYDDEEVVRISGSPDLFAEIDRAYLENEINKQLLEWIHENYSIPTASQYREAMSAAQEKLRRQGNDRFLKVYRGIFDNAEIAMELPITNERVDTSVIVTNLKELLAVTRAMPNSRFDADKIEARAFELMGLDVSDLVKTYEPIPLPSSRLLAPAVVPGMETAGGAMRALGGMAAPNVSRPTPSSALPTETSVAANAQTPLKQLAGIQ